MTCQKKKSRLWKTFRIVFDYLPVIGAILDSFKGFLNFNLYLYYKKVNNHPVVTSRYCFPHFQKDIAPDWKNGKECGIFLWGLNTLPKGPDKDGF